MHKKNSLINYNLFDPYKNLLAFTTTKKALNNNVPRFTGDKPTDYLINRKKLAALININEKQLLFPRQTHTNCVATISNFPKLELKETDALVTNVKEICLCVQTADCVPILLFDPVNKVIAAVHAGWRGTVKKIAANTIKKMSEEYGCSSKNILAVIGPSIGPEVYEIGSEVIASIENNSPFLKKAVIMKNSGKTHFDLWEANRLILIDSWLSEENIETSKECSFSEKEKYFSARRDGVETGRMVSGIMLLE